MTSHAERCLAAYQVLEGLSVGDALGEALSYQHHRVREIRDFSNFRPGTVRYTDDTSMAIVVFETLKRHQGIDEDTIARAFAARFQRDPDRGYGKMARRVLEEIGGGTDWRVASRNAFGGGSFGNGAAMRVAPLGAFFSDKLDFIPENAIRSARVTHFHREGIAGAIAVAVAAAVAFSSRELGRAEATELIWDAVLRLTPDGSVRARVAKARGMQGESAVAVAREVGCGFEVSAQDTVPFCIWSACRHLDNFAEAFLSTVEVGGDCDTNCAIACGIVTGHTGASAIPEDWLKAREPLYVTP